MASPAYQTKTAFATGTGSISVDFSGLVAANDGLLIVVEQANQPISSITGMDGKFTDRGTGTGGAAGAVGVQVFYKLVASGSETTFTVGDAGDHTTAIGIVIRPESGKTLGIDVSSGTDSQSIASGANISFEDVTTTVADTIIVHACGSDRDAGSTTNFTSPSNANLTSLLERHDQTVSNGQGGGIGVWTGLKATAGAIGNTLVSNNAGVTVVFATQTIAFKNVTSGYTLTADAASFTLTGADATLKADRSMAAATASFTLTGADAGLAKGFTLAASTAGFTLTGGAVSLPLTRVLTADTTSFALTGGAVAFPRAYALAANTASFTLTGADAGLSKTGSYSLTAAQASFTLTVSDAGLLRALQMQAASGSFTLSGGAVAFLNGKAMVAGAGAFTATFGDAVLSRMYALAAQTGQFVLTGADVDFSTSVLVPITRVPTGGRPGGPQSFARPLTVSGSRPRSVSTGRR